MNGTEEQTEDPSLVSPVEEDDNDNNDDNHPDMLTVVRSVLDQWNLTYEVSERSTPTVGIVVFGMSGMYTNYRATLCMDVEDDIFAVYYVCPIKIIERRRREIALYLAGANYRVAVGHFDLDFRDGEVRYKISVTLKGSRLSCEMVKQMIGISMNTLDKFFPGIMACAFGDQSAVDALQEALLPSNSVENGFDTAPQVTQ